jgi:hypothetical protein
LLRSARNDGASGEAIALQCRFQTADTSSRSRGAFRPSFVSRKRHRRDEGAGKAGRRPAPAIRALEKCTRGGPQVRRIARPFLRDGFNVSFVLSPGSDALLPPSPCGWLMCASGRATHITARLDAQAPGIRTTRLRRPRTSSLGLRELACAHARSHAKTLSAPCRSREGNRSRPRPPCKCRSRPTPSRPSHPSPRFVTIAIRPLSRARVVCLYDKSEIR